MRYLSRNITLSVLFAGLLVVMGLVIAQEGTHQHHHHDTKEAKSEAKEVTITGEIVDTACYVEHDAKGEAHAACAIACIDGGTPASLLDKDGKLYVILGENHKAPKAVVQGFVAQQVKVTGKLHEKGGVKFIVVSKIEKAG